MTLILDRSLTEAEMQDVMTQIMDGTVAEEDIAAFLTAAGPLEAVLWLDVEDGWDVYLDGARAGFGQRVASRIDGLVRADLSLAAGEHTLLVLVKGLPLGARSTQLEPGRPWSVEAEVTASVFDAIQHLMWSLGGAKGKRPKPYPRPGRHRRDRRPASDSELVALFGRPRPRLTGGEHRG